MIVKKTILLSVLLIMVSGVLACSKPPRDAKSISDSEMSSDSSSTTSQPAKPAGGGGAKLNENQW